MGSAVSLFTRESAPKLDGVGLGCKKRALQALIGRPRSSEITFETLPERFKATFASLDINIADSLPTADRSYISLIYGMLTSLEQQKRERHRLPWFDNADFQVPRRIERSRQ